MGNGAAAPLYFTVCSAPGTGVGRHILQRARPCWVVRDQGPNWHFSRRNEGPVLRTGMWPHTPQERVTREWLGPGWEPSSALGQRHSRPLRQGARAAGVNFASTAFNLFRLHSQCLNLSDSGLFGNERLSSTGPVCVYVTAPELGLSPTLPYPGQHSSSIHYRIKQTLGRDYNL